MDHEATIATAQKLGQILAGCLHPHERLQIIELVTSRTGRRELMRSLYNETKQLEELRTGAA